MNNDLKQFRALAIERLAYVGVKSPSEKQTIQMIEILSTVSLSRKLLFDTRLTNREAMCLYYAATGKYVQEVAEILEVSEVTIKFHRQNIKQKLGANTMEHAVFLGTRYGYLNLTTENK